MSAILAWLRRPPAVHDAWGASALVRAVQDPFTVRLWPAASLIVASLAGAVLLALRETSAWPVAALLLLGAWLGVALAFVRPLACAVLLFAALLLSPRIVVAGLPAGFFVRLDDFLLLGLLARVLTTGAPPCGGGAETAAAPMIGSPVDRAYSAFLLLAALSTMTGIFRGLAAFPFESAGTLAKFWQMALVFFVVRALGFDRPQRARLQRACLLILGVTAAAGTLWGLLGLCGALSALAGRLPDGAFAIGVADWLRWHPGARIFNSGWYRFEANHFGIVFAMAAPLLFLRAWRSPRRRSQGVWAALGLCAVLAMAFSGARGAALALVGALLAALLWRARGWRRWGLALTLPALLGLALWWGASRTLEPSLRNTSAVARVLDGFYEWRQWRLSAHAQAEGYLPDFSYHRNRFATWVRLSRDFPRAPVLGVGYGARPRRLYENHFVMALSEGGMGGLLAFLFLHARIARWLRFRARTAATVHGLGLSHAVIVLAGMTSIAGFIIRVWTPFAFLLALEENPESDQRR